MWWPVFALEQFYIVFVLFNEVAFKTKNRQL